MLFLLSKVIGDSMIFIKISFIWWDNKDRKKLNTTSTTEEPRKNCMHFCIPFLDLIALSSIILKRRKIPLMLKRKPFRSSTNPKISKILTNRKNKSHTKAPSYPPNPTISIPFFNHSTAALFGKALTILWKWDPNPKEYQKPPKKKQCKKKIKTK